MACRAPGQRRCTVLLVRRGRRAAGRARPAAVLDHRLARRAAAAPARSAPGWPRAPSTTTSSSSPRAWSRARSCRPVERALSASVSANGSRPARRAGARAGAVAGGRVCEVRLVRRSDRVALELEPTASRCALALDWDRRSDERFVGLGARHCTQLDQAGRSVQLGADRRYTGPDCPAEMLAAGGHPAGRLRARCRGCCRAAATRVWVRTEANGTRFDLAGERVSVSTRGGGRAARRSSCFCHATPAARLRAFCRLTGLPGGPARVGLRLLEEPRRLRAPGRRARRLRRASAEHDIPLDAIVIDSPWATQYNTWEFNPHQFPDAPGMIRRMRADGRADGGVGDAVGQPRLARRADPAAARVRAAAPRARPELRRRRRRPATSCASPPASRS